MTTTEGGKRGRSAPKPPIDTDRSLGITRPANQHLSNYEIIASMHPKAKQELYLNAGIILDSGITSALFARHFLGSGGTGLITLEDFANLYGEDAQDPVVGAGLVIKPLSEYDITASQDPIALIDQAFFDTLQTRLDATITAMSTGQVSTISQDAQRAHQRLLMIGSNTGLDIKNLVVDDAVSSLVHDMSTFTEKVVEVVPVFFEKFQAGRRPEKGLDNGTYTKLVKAAFPMLLEADFADVPKPSIETRKALFDWYADLALGQYYLPPSDSNLILPQR